jgi:hypothetical protein
MTKGLFALLLAGTLVVPLSVPAFGEDGTVGLGAGRDVQAPPPAWDARLLPPVPHLDAMPWLYSGKPTSALGIEHLYGPKLQTLGPFLLPPEIPPPRLSWDAAPAGVRPMAE